MSLKIRTLMSVFGCISLLLTGTGRSDDLPQNAKVTPGKFNNLDYFYIFGPDARKKDGLEDGLQILFYRVPRNASRNFILYLYDPGVSGELDRSDRISATTTVTRFSLYGGRGAYSDPSSQSVRPTVVQPGVLLDSKEYSDDAPDQWVKFGTYDLSQGETVGDFVYFKLVVYGTQGRLGNSFRTAVTPVSTKAFGYDNTIRLNQKRGSTMAFIIEAPAGTDTIIENSYDIDRGGTPYIVTHTERFRLRPSRSGRWKSNKVRIGPSSSTRMVRYEIVKGRQTYANCGFHFTDANGTPLKTFFEGEVTVPKVTPTPAPVVPATFNECETSTNLIRLNKQAPEEAALGEIYTMTIRVTALADLSNIMVHEVISDAASYVKSEPHGRPNGKIVTWTIDRMAKGGVKEISVQLKAEKEGDLINCASFAAIPIGCVATLVGNPMLAIEKSGPAQAILKDNVTYKIKVMNTGSAVAKNVEIIDNVPSGLNHQSGNDTLRFQVGDLAPKASKEVPITFGTTKAGRVCNIAEVKASNAASAMAEACTVIVERLLDLTKTGPREQYLGKTAKYQIKVANPGGAALSNVTVIDNAPPGTKIVNAPGATLDGGKARWIVPELAPGASKTFEIALTTNIAGEHCNTVAAASAEGLSRNSSACTLWKGYPALLMEVIDTVDPLQIGEKTTYEIRITNQGTAADINVGIVARFPAEISPIDTAGSTKGTIQGKTVTFSPYPKLAPKEVVSFVIGAEAVRVGDSRLIVEMRSGLLKTPVTEEESTHVY